MVGASVSSNAVSGRSIFGRADTVATAIIMNKTVRSRARLRTRSTLYNAYTPRPEKLHFADWRGYEAIQDKLYCIEHLFPENWPENWVGAFLLPKRRNLVGNNRRFKLSLFGIGHRSSAGHGAGRLGNTGHDQ